MEKRRISRRALLGNAPICLAIASATRPALAFQKLSQADARYQGTAKGSQRCENCFHFQSTNGCKFVQGEISPEGWCQLFTKRAGA